MTTYNDDPQDSLHIPALARTDTVQRLIERPDSGVTRYSKSIGAQIPAPNLVDIAYYQESARAEGTLQTYRRDWRTFSEWLDAHRLPHPAPGGPYSQQIIPAYLSAMAKGGYAASTISKHLAMLVVAFRKLGLPDPRAYSEDTMAGIQRRLGTAPVQKAPLTTDLLKVIIPAIPNNTLRGLRNRALLLFGFISALRRANLVGTTREELSIMQAGDVLRSMHFRSTRQQKTNQTGAVFELTIDAARSGTELCPVKAMRMWLSAARITTGPVFRYIGRDGITLGQPLCSDGSDVALIVKSAVRRVGLPADEFSAHSLRAGFVTQAFKSGADLEEIRSRTQHRSVQTLLGYYRKVQAAESRLTNLLLDSGWDSRHSDEAAVQTRQRYPGL